MTSAICRGELQPLFALCPAAWRHSHTCADLNPLMEAAHIDLLHATAAEFAVAALSGCARLPWNFSLRHVVGCCVLASLYALQQQRVHDSAFDALPLQSIADAVDGRGAAAGSEWNTLWYAPMARRFKECPSGVSVAPEEFRATPSVVSPKATEGGSTPQQAAKSQDQGNVSRTAMLIGQSSGFVASKAASPAAEGPPASGASELWYDHASAAEGIPVKLQKCFGARPLAAQGDEWDFESSDDDGASDGGASVFSQDVSAKLQFPTLGAQRQPQRC